MGLEKKIFGAMLIPVLMSKVPAELKLNMSRSLGKELWDVTVVLELMTELEARDKISSQSDNRVSKCVFCEFNHHAYKCTRKTV